MRKLFPTILLAVSAVACSHSGRVPVPAVLSLPPDGDLYFREDHFTGAEYLQLLRSGQYELIGVEHMGRWPLDQGRWEFREGRFLFHSNDRVLDIVSPPFRVSLGSFDDIALFSLLRRSIEAFLEAHSGATHASVEDLLAFQRATPPDGYAGHLAVDLDSEAEFKGAPIPLSRLRALLREIDTYETASDPRTFPYQLLEYRGIHLLICLAPGGALWLDSPTTIKAKIDENHGEPPPYLFIQVTKDTFEHGSAKTYPFKFYPEMNTDQE